jgi:hypothetical protein
MIVEFFKKIAKSIRSMFTEDNIAAAQIAQIFGSELLKVQQSVNDSASQPDIVKLNPKQFLLGTEVTKQHQAARERQLAEALQREAEMLHPLPRNLPPVSVPPQQAINPSPVPIAPVATPVATSSQFAVGGDFLERIATALERIANKIDSVDIKPKRKTIKRKTKSSKTILLNENRV